VRIFLARGVTRFAHRQRIADASLIEAIERAERGTIDADLGGGSSSSVWRGPVRGAPVGFG
jgi:hypothetical protein